MKRLIAFCLLATTIVAACTSTTTAPGASASGSAATGQHPKIGLVTDVGGLNDKSFNALADKGRKDAAAQLVVDTSVTESKQQADYVPNLTKYAQDKYDLVIGVGFLMQNAIWKVATQFPNVKFAIIDGAPADDTGAAKNLPNVANLFFKEQEAGYVVGVIAATMAKNKVGAATHNTVCSMGGLPIPPVDRYIAGYQDAVTKTSPTTKILNGYSQDFVDQQKGKEVGIKHIAAGLRHPLPGRGRQRYRVHQRGQGREGLRDRRRRRPGSRRSRHRDHERAQEGGRRSLPDDPLRPPRHLQGRR